MSEAAFPQNHDLEQKNIVALPSLSPGLALDDNVIEQVKYAWQRVTGAEPQTFMKFDARETLYEDNDDGE